MASRFHSWWMLFKKYRMVVISSVFVIFIALIVAGYVFNWDWMGLNGYSTISVRTNLSSKQMTRTEDFLPGKTFWDWMQLLFVPSVLTLGAVWFTARQNHDREIAREQHQNDLDIALDSQRETELEQYIDKISELLLEKKLRESGQTDEVRNIARVRTLIMLPRLDKERKRSVLRFLYESGLIDKDKHIIGLSYADLSAANLINADLRSVDLSHAYLDEADLCGAHLSLADLNGARLRNSDLSEADLSGANLSDAKLSQADLSGADLNGARLRNSDLSDAKLFNANLSGANLNGASVTPEQLGQAQLSKDTILPDGSKHSD